MLETAEPPVDVEAADRSRRILGVAPEALLFLLGCLLRLRLIVAFDHRWSYDWTTHLAYLEYVAEHHALPSLAYTMNAYHPPLYYWIGGFALRHGWTVQSVRSLSLLFGIARLGLVWYGLRRFLPRDGRARFMALALAAVLPCSLHLDAMLTNEALHCLLATAALLLVPPLFAAPAAERWRFALALGATLALCLLTKVSSLMLLAAIGMGALYELCAVAGDWRRRLHRAVAPGLAIVIALGVSLPIQARHRAETGKLYPTGFDSPKINVKYHQEALQGIPYLHRRPLGYVFGLGSGAVLKLPYYPSDSQPDSHFWPVLLATTFGDYWCYRFDGQPRPGEETIRTVNYPPRVSSARLARASVASGIVIALLVISALLRTGQLALRRREIARVVLLLVPVLATAGQLHWAILTPFDETGLIKGHYLQFAAAPLFALFGVAVSWAWRRRATAAIAVLAMGALLMVGAYTLHAQRFLLG